MHWPPEACHSKLYIAHINLYPDDELGFVSPVRMPTFKPLRQDLCYRLIARWKAKHFKLHS